jgi:archaellum biogenesis ATPase FlaH
VSDFKEDDWTWQLEFNQDEMRQRIEEANTFQTPKTGLSFLDDHFGARPGCLHTLLGSVGRGKSTLIQSLVLSWGLEQNVLLYQTEESVERIERKLFEKDNQAAYLTTKLHIVMESEFLKTYQPNNAAGFLRLFEAKIVASKAKVVILDNLTTSAYYEGKFTNVLPILSGLTALAEKYKVPVFVVCHTKKGVTEATKGLISPDDVRGSALVYNKSDYFYTFYRVRKTGITGSSMDAAFVYVNKSRDHDNQDSIYRLVYDVNKKRYMSDVKIDFEKFKTAIRERDKL